jgi:hypothetical protein
VRWMGGQCWRRFERSVEGTAELERHGTRNLSRSGKKLLRLMQNKLSAHEWTDLCEADHERRTSIDLDENQADERDITIAS